MNLYHTKISEKDILELSRLITEREGVPIECEQELSGTWLHSSDWETELRLLAFLNQRLTVSRVCFQKRRKGTMTAVLEWMKTFCEKNCISEIVVQSVETPEMAAWCRKNGFRPNPSASLMCSEGFIIGDYRFQKQH